MPNFKFECEHRNAWDSTLEIRNTTECEYVQLDDVIMAFQDFLRGSGFYFDGNLEIVGNDKPDAWVADVGEKPTSDEVGANVMSWTANELTKEPNANQG